MRIKLIVQTGDADTTVSYEGEWDTRVRPSPTAGQRLEFQTPDGSSINLRVCTRHEIVYDVRKNRLDVWLVPLAEPTMAEHEWRHRLSQALRYSLQSEQ